MRKSFSQTALTLLVVGLTFTALSDRASARGGGGGGGSSRSFSARSSNSYSRPTSFSYSRQSSIFSSNRQAFHPTTSSAFSAFSKSNNISGKPSNLLSKSFQGNFSTISGKSSFSKFANTSKFSNTSKFASSSKFSSFSKNSYGKYGYGKYGYGKYGCPWYGCCYPWYGCCGCCDYCCYCDNPYYSSCCSCDGYPTCGDATFADLPSDSAVVSAAPAEPSASQVLILNPAENQSTLAYSINGQSYTLKAGDSHRLDAMPDMTIEFDRGLSGDPARYPLTAGTYTFKSTDKGWDLVSDSPSASATPGLVADTPQTTLAGAPQNGPALSAPQNGLATGGPQNGLTAGGPQNGLVASGPQY